MIPVLIPAPRFGSTETAAVHAHAAQPARDEDEHHVPGATLIALARRCGKGRDERKELLRELAEARDPDDG